MTSINALLNNYPHFIQHPDELLSLSSATLQSFRIYIGSLQNGQNRHVLDYLDSVICQAIDLKNGHLLRSVERILQDFITNGNAPEDLANWIQSLPNAELLTHYVRKKIETQPGWQIHFRMASLHHHIRNSHQAPQGVCPEHTISRGIVDPSTRRVQQIYSAKRGRVPNDPTACFKRGRYCEPMNVA